MRRFLIGLVINCVAVLLLFCGIRFLVLWLVYLGSVFLGVGTALTFLPAMGYIKYFPPVYVSLYVAGLAFAGFLLSAVYLVALHFRFDFKQVNRVIV